MHALSEIVAYTKLVGYVSIIIYIYWRIVCAFVKYISQSVEYSYFLLSAVIPRYRRIGQLRA